MPGSGDKILAPQDTGERTRGGWVPTGINATRRERRSERSRGRGDEVEAQLIAAARTVFARQGFYAARIQDVLDILQMSRGAFYVYFANKREVFDRVHETVLQELSAAISASDGDVPDDDGLLAELIHSNTRFLRFYVQNWEILRSVEQVAAVDEHAARLSAKNRRFHVQRVRRLVERWQYAGLADASVDSEAAAVALVTMLSGTAQFLARGELDQTDEELGRALSQLWARALGLVT